MFLVGACRLASFSWCSEKIRRRWSQTPTAKHTVTDNGIHKLPLCRRCSSSSPLLCDFPPLKSSFLVSLMFLYDCPSKTEYHIPTFWSHLDPISDEAEGTQVSWSSPDGPCHRWTGAACRWAGKSFWRLVCLWAPNSSSASSADTLKNKIGF